MKTLTGAFFDRFPWEISAYPIVVSLPYEELLLAKVFPFQIHFSSAHEKFFHFIISTWIINMFGCILLPNKLALHIHHNFKLHSHFHGLVPTPQIHFLMYVGVQYEEELLYSCLELPPLPYMIGILLLQLLQQRRTMDLDNLFSELYIMISFHNQG